MFEIHQRHYLQFQTKIVLRILILLLSLFSFTCNLQQEELPFQSNEASETSGIEVSGLSFVAPPNPFPKDPMPAVKAINSEWIALIPYAYTPLNKPLVRYNLNQQWWGEQIVGIEESIRLAKASKIKILLKPQVYVPGGWPGNMEYEKEEDWKIWEEAYLKYILEFAKIAEAHKIEMFCVGTEFKKSVQQRPFYWKALIQKVRDVYAGKLVYAANWDCYQKTPFWKDLDYIGIDAYFPLVNKKLPTKKELMEKWQPIARDMEKFQSKINKPILFTEFGYMALEGCAYNTWELESKINQTKISEEAQANALDALFTVFKTKPWWHGGFLWKWFPNMQGHEGYLDKDYTPQGKLAYKIVQQHYHK